MTNNNLESSLRTAFFNIMYQNSQKFADTNYYYLFCNRLASPKLQTVL